MHAVDKQLKYAGLQLFSSIDVDSAPKKLVPEHPSCIWTSVARHRSTQHHEQGKKIPEPNENLIAGKQLRSVVNQ